MENDNMTLKTILGLLARHMIGAAGVWLVQHGYMDADTATMQMFVGSVMFLAAIAWSIAQKVGFIANVAKRVRLSMAIEQAQAARAMSENVQKNTASRTPLQGGGGVGLMIVFALLGWSSDSRAADMPTPIAKPRVLETYQGSGWYYGVHTFAENQKTNVDPTLTNAYTVGGAAGVTLGYMWGANGVSWQALDFMVSYKNVGGDVPMAKDTLTLDSRWSFTQRFKFGGSPSVLMALLPNMGTLFPALPPPPAGGVGYTHPYLFVASHEDDVSESAGVQIGRAWRIKGGFGVGLMQQLGRAQNNPNGAAVVMDVWAEYIPPSSVITFGLPADFIKLRSGRETRFGAAVLF